MRRRLGAACLLALTLALAGCAASPLVRAARSGDRAALRAQLSQARARGKLDAGAVRDVARGVLGAAIASLPMPELDQRLHALRACARAVEPALESRADGADDAAGAALLLLVDEGLAGRGGKTRRYADDASPYFRAVAARAAIGDDHAARRRALTADPDERVRLAALRAALDAGDAGDAPALLDAARLDPSPLGRTLAVRALGRIGGDAVVTGLRDRWPTADDAVRQAIVDAWSMPRARDAGGAREVERVLATAEGAVAIAAAAAVVGAKGDDVARAVDVLARSIRKGVSRDRVLAIARAPLDRAEVRAALEATLADPDVGVRVAALARATEVAALRASATDKLRALADEGRAAATLALARLHDARARPSLVRDVASPLGATRLEAARGLVELGEPVAAADLLADDDADVRLGAACAMLAPR